MTETATTMMFVQILVVSPALPVAMVFSTQANSVMMAITITMTPVQISVSQVRQMRALWA